MVYKKFAQALPRRRLPKESRMNMKKAAALLLSVLTAVTVFASCGKNKKIYTDPKEYSKALAESEKESAEAESERNSEIESDIQELELELGKTEKGKQIVVKKEYNGLVIYEKTIFKKGIADYMLLYKYYDKDEDYEQQVEFGDNGNEKLIEHDKKTRCLIYKNTDVLDLDYEAFYELYDRKDHNIIQIVE